MTRRELVDIEVQIHVETDNAVLVSDDGNKANAVWLPRSQIEIEKNDGTVIVTLPVWLAEDKGML